MVVLIGENLNIMSLTYGPALKTRDPKPIHELVKQETANGMDYIDVNIGPARKQGAELMEWAVKTAQEVTSLPLSLDTTNPVAMEAGLKVHKGKALLNSISPVRAAEELPFIGKYGAAMVGLLWGPEGMPRDAAERAMLAVDLVYKANEAGVANEDIWIDPIVSPVCVEINQVKACVEFMAMLPEIAPGCKTTVGMSNISNGAPAHLRGWLNRAYMIMLMKYGLYSAIVDAFDEDLARIAKGLRPDLVSLVQGMMDGDRPDPAKLDDEHLKYYKTARVLLGESLYSHSWLDI